MELKSKGQIENERLLWEQKFVEIMEIDTWSISKKFNLKSYTSYSKKIYIQIPNSILCHCFTYHIISAGE